MGKLEGKVCIVTGVARGLGRAFALKLAEEGADVCVCDVEFEGAQKVADEIRERGRRALALKVDVSSPEDTKMMAQKTYETFGRIDGLVNNAALIYGLGRRPFYEIDPLLFDRVMQVNVKGVWLCVCAVFPYMKQQGKGKIVNIASEVAFSGSIGFIHYVASKGGVVALTRALANELGQYNICVNAVAPGFIDNEAGRTIADVTKYDVSLTPLRRLGKPEDIVGIVAFLLSDEADFISGQTILVNGGRVKH
uniref:3-oxoacyl-ACP reductase FabG n=1 Tax=candidate division WOR-3 bacterium TaxID=2052148 RepID=A0A7C2K336_UNCW3